jgi:transcriptional regulator with XRE-family HTH domain
MEEHLGTRIRALRERLRMPVAELAEKAGITRQYLYLIERGVATDPGVQTIVLIAKTLGVTTDYLLLGKRPPRWVRAEGEDEPTLLDLVAP